jgi:hypothetical protein
MPSPQTISYERFPPLVPNVLMELVKLGYQIRMTSISETEFGLCGYKRLLIIFLSKIGLPNLPGKLHLMFVVMVV